MYTRHNIYVVSTDNKEPVLSATFVQLILYKQKCARSSSIKINLTGQHPSALASLEEQ